MVELIREPNLIFSKIPTIMAEIGAISKSRTNTHQNYQFRGIEDMYAAFHPVLVKHAVFCAPEVIESQTQTIEGINQSGQTKVSHRVLLRIRHRFFAQDGSYVDVTTQGEGIDTSDKASNKATSAAMKYAFIELFSIPTSDIEDSERESPEMSSRIANPPRQVQPTSPQQSQNQPQSGAYCEACGTELRLSKAGTGFYCPNFNDKSKGEHTRFPANQLMEFKSKIGLFPENDVP